MAKTTINGMRLRNRLVRSATWEGMRDVSPVRKKIHKPEMEAYNLDLARRFRDVVVCPLMVVGGFRSFDVAERAVSIDGMDYISMARPLIREPGLKEGVCYGKEGSNLQITQEVFICSYPLSLQ